MMKKSEKTIAPSGLIGIDVQKSSRLGRVGDSAFAVLGIYVDCA